MASNRFQSTGYVRTDVIGNYDLHPDQGYEFPPNSSQKPSRTQKTSSMFPLNKKVNDRVRPVEVTEAAPEGVIDPVMPQVRRHRSKLIFDTMINMRTKQVNYSEQRRQYDQAVKAAEEETEMRQVAAAKEQELRDKQKRDRKIAELRTFYTTQLDEVAKRRKRERDEELAYEAELQRQNAIKDEEERKKQERLRQIAQERRDEFRRRNEEILMRRATRQEQEIEEEKRIQRENAEVQARRDERDAEDKRRRMEKTNAREKVIETMSREMTKQMQKNQQVQEAAESAAAQATMRQVMTLREKQEQMVEDRHREWLKMQKEREARRRNGFKQPFPLKKKEIDAEAFAAKQRKIEEERLKTYQRRQIEERKRRDQQEIDDDIALDNAMLDATQAKFDKSLSQLQTLIPSELGITVPTYSVRNTLSRERW